MRRGAAAVLVLALVPGWRVAAAPVGAKRRTPPRRVVIARTVSRGRHGGAVVGRDPFRPPSFPSAELAHENRPPLLRYDLGQLKLVGTIHGVREPVALIEDAEGLGYIIRVGTRIGVNDGVVKSIGKGRVVIEEHPVSIYGQRRTVRVVMKLGSAERGK